MTSLPDPAPATPAAPQQTEVGVRRLNELVGKVVNVDQVEDVDGIPVIIVSHDDGVARQYLCSDDKAGEGATIIEATINTTKAPFTTKVVEHAGHIWFVDPNDTRFNG